MSTLRLLSLLRLTSQCCQVFVLTDGEVDNTNEVLTYVKNNTIPGVRVFTLGIGGQASKDLVNGLAYYGRGGSEFVVSGERMETKVMAQLKHVCNCFPICFSTERSQTLYVGLATHSEEHCRRLGRSSGAT